MGHSSCSLSSEAYSAYLSGGVADSVQGEQVSGVGHGVELRDGEAQGIF